MTLRRPATPTRPRRCPAVPRVVAALALATLTGGSEAETASAGPPDRIAALARPNVVVMLRHANAPGIGDPDGFRLQDCATQRNLDHRGRTQAARLGAAWRAAGVRPTTVWSSAWCRCLETARLMDLGPVTVLPLLNSFFGNSGSRERQTAQLSRFIDELDPRNGPYLMVTHQINITALSGHGAETGGGILIELPVDGTPRRIWPLPAAVASAID